jgi:outer membrane protein
MAGSIAAPKVEIVLRHTVWIGAVLAASTFFAGWAPAQAETLSGALARAYRNNHSLNVARAQLRATDENVPQAKSQLRPFVSGTSSLTATQSRSTRGDNLATVTSRSNAASAGITINQTIFDGFQTPNNIRAAEAQVKASQENLANTEQNTLLDATSVYMNVLRDRQIADLRRQNLSFLQEQVRAARARFDVGEGTRTDVAQAESEQALSTALLNSALAQVATSEANYFQIIGDAPNDLTPGRQPKGIIPTSISSALAISQKEHPAILANIYAVDAAAFQVKSAEGTLLPSLSVSGTVQNEYSMSDSDPNTLPGVDVSTQNDLAARVGATLTIPIYQGGLRSSQIRQAKEVLGQRQIEVDSARDQVRAAVATAWAELQAARANVSGYSAQVAAARLALNGVIEERNVGQRTTLDVLNAQADVISAQILLVGSQRDEVVAGYSLSSAIGRLSASRLGLNVAVYQPKEHYDAVKDKWYGLRTPDGR